MSKIIQKVEDLEAVVAKHTSDLEAAASGSIILDDEVEAGCVVKEAVADGHHACS